MDYTGNYYAVLDTSQYPCNPVYIPRPIGGKDDKDKNLRYPEY